MNIYSHAEERCRDLQRQLHEAEQFRALVREYLLVARRCRRLGRNFHRGDQRKRATRDLRTLRASLRAQIDQQLSLLPGE